MTHPDHRLPLVLVPGHMGTALSWHYQREALKSEREIIVPDRHYALPSIQEMAREIAATLPPRFDLAGWSMGGYIVLELYPLVRERVGRLILISTSARPEHEEAKARRAELLESVAADGLAVVWRRQFQRFVVDPSRLYEGFKERVIQDSVRLGEEVLRSQIKAISARRDTRGELGRIGCKTLVIGGREDVIIPVECAQEIADAVPHAALHVLDDVGHCLPWERPNLVNAIMHQFLSDA